MFGLPEIELPGPLDDMFFNKGALGVRE